MDFDAFFEALREAQSIKCPHCGAAQDHETEAAHTSYHGDEDGPQECWCSHCDKDFFVHEYVRREWRSGKTRDEARGL